MRNSELELKVPQAGLVAVDGKTFPLTSAQIEAVAQGGIAHTTLRQAYHNPYDEPLEVAYTLPLPADGAVTGFDIRVGEKRIVGEVESHDKALRKYRQALEDGRVAGILEQNRADTFTQNLGNVPPKTGVEVEIRVLHPVAFRGAPDRDQTANAGMDSDSGSRPAEWEYRFPTVVGTRYEGAPGRVPDRDRLDVDRAEGGTPVRLSLNLAIGDGAPADLMLRSASHAIRVEDGTDAGTSIVRFEDPSRLDRDVTISWRAATDDVGVRLVEGSGLEGDKGRYGLLTIVPPNRPDRTISRDVTLLIDASGSMSGPPIDAARELCARIVRSLSPRDRFQILSFASTVERIVGEPTEATPANIANGIQALSRLQASGATEMAKAIEEALRPLRGDSQRQVVLMTDGYIGFEQEVVERILNHLPPGARLHVVGIGSAPNRTLTRGGSRAGRGVEVIVSGTEAVEDAARRLLAATVAPVLTDITIDGAAVVAVAPERPRDVLAGQPVVIALELSPKGGEVRVSGIVQGSSEGWTRTVKVGPSVAAGNGGAKKVHAVEPADADPVDTAPRTDLPIGALFGREAIADEEMKLAATRDSKEVLTRIEALGLRHRIASRCTSLVAVADEPSVDPSKPRRRMRLTVEMPAGVNPEAVGYGRSAPMASLHAAPYSPVSGPLFSEGARASAFSLYPSEPPLPPLEIAARCVRTEGDLLVIEFESPHDRFKLPRAGSKMTVIAEDGEEIVVTIEKDLSTNAGPHASGLTLRLALRRVDGLQWKPGIVRVVPASHKRPEIVVEIA